MKKIQNDMSASGREYLGAQFIHSSSSQQNSRQQQIEWCRLVRDRRWSQAQKFRLITALETPAKLYSTDDHGLRQILGEPFRCGTPPVCNNDLMQDRAWLDRPENTLITLNDSRYPPLLREINDPPIALFAIGNIALLQEPKVAIVGSRQPTPVGSNVTNKLAAELAKLGIVVTSGMALGIDGLAHQAALDASESTIAVMGCGLDIVYPARHRRLFNQIKSHGLLLSEYPLGYKPTKYTFPQRNRIVSGLSHGVIIIEAAERSGTLITAGLAMDQGREVMVVPGSSLSAQYRGSHKLLRDGAALVTEVADVLDVLANPLQALLSEQAHSVQPDLNEAREKTADHQLLGYIGSESTSMEQIIQASGLTAAEVSAMLLALELEGLIAVATDGGYVNLS